MRRFVLVCMLMLLPLQWSWAAAAWYGAHADGHDATATCGQSSPTPADAPSPSGNDVASSDAETTGGDACCHLDDPQWIDALPAVMAQQQAPPPRFEYFAPTSSHIPAGPERPDRSLAA
jgi:hypothetical protein